MARRGRYHARDSSRFPTLKPGEMPLTRRILDLFHPRSRRAAPAPGQEGGDGRFFTLDHGFHRSVATVAHPAGDTQPLGFLAHGFPVPDALYLAVDAQVPGDHALSPQTAWMGSDQGVWSAYLSSSGRIRPAREKVFRPV